MHNARTQEHFEQSPIATLRDCLEFNSDRPPIDISEVCVCLCVYMCSLCNIIKAWPCPRIKRLEMLESFHHLGQWPSS